MPKLETNACRVQNPDISRAGRVGAHGGVDDEHIALVHAAGKEEPADEDSLRSASSKLLDRLVEEWPVPLSGSCASFGLRSASARAPLLLPSSIRAPLAADP